MKVIVFVLGAALTLASCSGGSGGGLPPGGGGGAPNPAACPSNGSVPTAMIGASVQSAGRIAPAGSPAAFVPGELAITFARGKNSSRILQAANALHAVPVQGDLDFHALGVTTRIVNVDPSQTGAALAQLRSLPGVKGVAQVKYASRMTISANDPYYAGFSAPAPFYETSTTPGQWDMHVINVEAAWNQVSASAPVVGAKAPIAVIDTGVDVTHPDLAGGTITRVRCFITFPSSSAQTTGTFVTDTDGHGTNVSGIAAADSNNGLGFVGASYDAKLMAYRVFPANPSGGCEGAAQTNPQCSTTGPDEASAINDAVANGAKVINLSLGSQPPCNTSDPEYQAVENAIANNVVVVAAAGNGDSAHVGQPFLTCPAADPGVIAVGASGLDDSIPALIQEAVAPYSNYVSPSNGSFLLAPGGNAASSSDTDNLHWVENIFSSTTATSSTYCKPDLGGGSSVIDCRVEIEGTSQATPHVAAAAALILAVRPSYTPAQVATALCNSAVDIGSGKEGCGRLDVNAAITYALAH